MKRVVAAGVLVAALLPACGGTDRPEGVVERWLISLNQGAAGRPGRYAPESISRSILSGWNHCDPSALDAVEVGKGREFVTDRPVPRTKGAAVPYRIEYASGLDTSCNDPNAQHSGSEGIAILQRREGTWRITKLTAASLPGPGRSTNESTEFVGLRVPSQGGQRVGGATLGQWLAGVGVGVALALLVVALMRLAPKPVPLPRRE